MLKKPAVITASFVMMLAMTSPVFADAPTPALSTVLTQANQAIQAAKKAEQTDQGSYQALLQQATTALSQASSGSTISFSMNVTSTTTVLQTDVHAISNAKTLTALKAALNTLSRDMEKVKNKLDHQSEQRGNEQRNSLKNVLSDSQHSLSKFVHEVQNEISTVQSLTNEVSSTATKAQIKQLMNSVKKLGKDVFKMDSKFKKWDAKIEQRLTTVKTLLPPAPPSGTSSGSSTSSSTSTATPPSPPAPPAPPANP